MAKALLRVLNALINGNTAKAQSLWENSPLSGPLGFGPWSSAIVAQAADNGVSIYTMVANDAEWIFGQLYRQQNPGDIPNPFGYVSRETNFGGRVHG